MLYVIFSEYRQDKNRENDQFFELRSFYGVRKIRAMSKMSACNKMYMLKQQIRDLLFHYSHSYVSITRNSKVPGLHNPICL